MVAGEQGWTAKSGQGGGHFLRSYHAQQRDPFTQPGMLPDGREWIVVATHMVSLSNHQSLVVAAQKD
jgi:hypothetical protein